MAAREIEAAALTTFEVVPDGTRVRLNVEDADGQPATLVLPTACLQQLVMTLPAMVQRALQRRHRDETLKASFRSGTGVWSAR